MLEDAYGKYTPGPPLPPVPPFPCINDPSCTSSNRICSTHKFVLFVKFIKKGGHSGFRDIEIPYGKWENWEWYSDRISEATGIPHENFKMIFAGCRRTRQSGRHSGLQFQSTIHCLLDDDF